MSTRVPLPGNDPAGAADGILVHAHDDDRFPRAQAYATLALAEEQRTANLIALLVGTNPISGTPLLPAQGARDRVAAAITARLALLDGAL